MAGVDGAGIIVENSTFACDDFSTAWFRDRPTDR